MAEDLTPKIISAHDSAELSPAGSARPTTIVNFMVGRFGPFTATFDRDPPPHVIDAAMQAKREMLTGRV